MRGERVYDLQGIGPVTFYKNPRARYVVISVRALDGVRVAVPQRTSFRDAKELTDEHAAWIQKTWEKCRSAQTKTHESSDECSPEIRRQAEEKLSGMLEDLARRFGFSYGRVLFRHQKTRWGSCSVKNNISLNVQLASIPERLAEYVILHELVHTRIKSHGRRFWRDLEGCLPGARKLASELRRYDPR